MELELWSDMWKKKVARVSGGGERAIPVPKLLVNLV